MKTILIVDDSLTSRMFVKKCVQLVLKNIEVKFVEAKNGEDALKKVTENEIDWVISDVNMPVMNGFTFLRNIRSMPQYASLPIVFVTSLANQSRVDNLMQLGATAVIKKPISPQGLSEVVSKFDEEQQQEEQVDDGWG